MTNRRHLPAAVTSLIAIGAFAAVQTRVNGELARAIGTGVRAGFAAAAISFITGLIALTVVVISRREQREALGRLRGLARGGTLPRWHLLGGLAGALMVASQGLTAATLGVALFTVAVVAGQTTSALGVDKFGLGPRGPQRINALRILAAICTLVAVVLTVAGKFSGTQGIALSVLALVILPLLSGAGSSVQQAINGHVAHNTSAWVATWNNFLVGSTVLLVLLGISMFFPGKFYGFPPQWWLYSGGLIGVTFIAVTSVLVRVHGVLLLALCTIAGQVTAAAILDAFNPEIPVGISTLLGVVLTLVGIGLALIGSYSVTRPPGRKPADM